MRVILLILALLVSTQANAELFYSTALAKSWYVAGERSVKDSNPVCAALVKAPDGTTFQLAKDLTDYEVYIHLFNPTWIIKDPMIRVRINFYNKDKLTYGLTFNGKRMSKSIVVLPELDKKATFYWFTRSTRLVVVMPGDMENMSVNLVPDESMFTNLSKCVDQYADYIKKASGQI